MMLHSPRRVGWSVRRQAYGSRMVEAEPASALRPGGDGRVDPRRDGELAQALTGRVAPRETDLEPPGEREIYRIGRTVFRVWADRPNATAELYRDGDWVWTAIPSGAIIHNPQSVRLEPEEARKFRATE